MVHHHSAHPLVSASISVVPETNVDRAVVLLIALVECHTLLNSFRLIIFLASANQMKAVKGVPTFYSEALVTHLELDFVPKAVLVVGLEGILGGLELYRERSEVHEIAYIGFDFDLIGVGILVNIEICSGLHVVHLSINQLFDRLIHVDIFLCVIFCVHVVHLMESHLIGFNEGTIDVELTLILNAIVEEAWIHLTLLDNLLLGPQTRLYLVFSGHQPANHFVVLLR